MNKRQRIELSTYLTESEAILEYLELRKEKRIGEILNDGNGVYYRVESEVNPWGSKIFIGTSGFIRMVEEARHERIKGIRKEVREERGEVDREIKSG